MNREEAISLVRKNITKENLFKHMLAVEAIMRGCAKFLKENGEDVDIERWGLLGIIHDIDFEKAPGPEKHCTLASEILCGKVDEKLLRAIMSHNFDNLDVQPESEMEYCLIAADSISGLIIAAALIIPTKKLRDVKVESISKRFKEKDFARNCSRERILYCEKVGIQKEKFFEIALESMQDINSELGL